MYMYVYVYIYICIYIYILIIMSYYEVNWRSCHVIVIAMCHF